MSKILLVDDSSTIRTQLRQVLEKEGYVIIEGEDGLDGLRKLEENKDVALIICDVNMPNMDGITMCEKVFETEGSVKIPKFMLTTEANKDLKERAKAAGVVAWVAKPCSGEKLTAVIKKVLER